MKKRLLYLDICRFWAIFLVIIYHIDVHMTTRGISSSKSFVIQNNNFSGVTLFVLLSGLTLTMNLKDRKNIDWKLFYKRRFLSVLPLLWITYILQYFRLFYINGTSPIIHEKWRIIFSILGLDGYLSRITTTFYLGVGEWFIGMVLLFYIIFPLLFHLLKKSVLIFSTLALVVYVFSFFTISPIGYPTLFSMIPLFSVGMLLGYYDPDINLKSFLLLLIPFFIFQIIYIPKIAYSTTSISDIVVSITGLLCLKYICKFISFTPIEKIFKQLSQMSYGMTLVNQQVIIYFTTIFANRLLTNTDMLSLYMLIFIVIYLLSVLLNYIHTRIFQYFT